MLTSPQVLLEFSRFYKFKQHLLYKKASFCYDTGKYRRPSVII